MNNMAQLNSVLKKSAMKLEKKVKIRLGKKLAEKNFRKVMAGSQLFNHMRSYHYSLQENHEIQLTLNYIDSTRMLAAHRNPELLAQLEKDEIRALVEAQKRVKNCSRAGMKRMDIVKAIHDDLIRRVKYDRGAGPECTRMILENKGVCDAYSRCMYLMLQIAEIPCHMVVGKARGAHIWNLVQMDDDEWYHVDATWDDPPGQMGKNILRHDYFCLSDAEICTDHKWDVDQYPATPRRDAAFYRKNDRYFGTYEAFWKDVQKAHRAGKTEHDAYLGCYRNEKTFKENLKLYLEKKGSAPIRSWIPPHNRRAGVVVIKFGQKQDKANKSALKPDNHASSSLADDFPEQEDNPEPPEEEEVPKWLDRKIWKEVTPSLSMDGVVRGGSKLLLKGINAAEKGVRDFDKTADDFKKTSKSMLDGFMKKMKE